jgi:hypothetical protein
MKLPACEFALLVPAMARAGDGTVWIADTGCSRLIHLSADGTPTVIDLPDQLPKSVAGDAAGGAWFSDRTDAIGGHVDGAGHVTYVRHGDDHGAGVAVAPDGAAWFALGRCRLARVAPDGSLTLEPSPLPATSIAFDPSGGLWLASETRLVHSSVGALGTGTCDDTPPQIELPRAGRVSLGALRRGLRVAVREPAYVTALLSLEHGSRHAVLPQRERQFTRAGSVRLHVGAKQLRRLFRGRHPTVTLTVTAEDRDGNQAAREVTLHVVR